MLLGVDKIALLALPKSFSLAILVQNCTPSNLTLMLSGQQNFRTLLPINCFQYIPCPSSNNVLFLKIAWGKVFHELELLRFLRCSLIISTTMYCCGAGYRWRARPLGGAVESSPPNTRNLGRDPRISPKGTGPLQDHESPIIRLRGVGLIAKLQYT